MHNSIPVPHNSENQISTNVYPLDTSSNAILQEYDDPPSTMGIYETSSSMAPSLVDALHAINAHLMMTRSKCGIFKPKVYLVDYTQHEPCDVKEALKHPHWKKAMEDEYTALMNNNTWTFVHRLVDKKRNHWVQIGFQNQKKL